MGLGWVVRWVWGLLLGLCAGLAWAAPAVTSASAVASAVAPTLLWITGEITPAARSAQVEQGARQLGLQVLQLDYPLQHAPQLNEAERTTLQAAIARAGLVWIDAPHASVEARLHSLLDADLRRAARPPVWITAGALSPEAARATDPHPRMTAYLQAGGPAQLGHALQLAAALLQGRDVAALHLPPPQALPSRGVYHPDAPGLLPDARALAQWQATQAALQALPRVAVLVHRSHWVNGSTAWLDAWLRQFQAQGLLAYAVFGQQADAATLSALLEDAQGHPLAQALVLHQLVPQAGALQPLFSRWGLPLLATQPYRAGDVATWEADSQGLSTSDVPFYLAQPEAAGAIDPLPVLAYADQGRQPVLIERQSAAVVAKARRLIALQTLPAVQKKLVVMVYNYPPGGSNFGASFLNVPRSLEQVSGALAQAGYRTESVPEATWIAELQPLLRAYYPGADLRALLQSGQAEALPLARYLDWWRGLPAAVRQRIAQQWGPPERSHYVVQWQGQPVFVIPRARHGQLAVLPQPPREETLHQGQNPFMHRSKTPLSHHYLAVYLWAGQADALLHFGTHGTQEWAEGKARALDVWDDALLPLSSAANHIPVVYPYIVDNLGEALTAKRRGRALLLSHRTPTLAPAGFAARMARMHELMHEWETADRGPTRNALEAQLIEQFVEHQLHRDLGWSAERIRADFEGYLEQLHPYLDQLAQNSQPQGLAVYGQVPTPEARRMSILQMLRQPLINALGEDIDEAFLIDYQAVARARPMRWLELALRDAPAASVLDLRPPLAHDPAPATGADAVPNRAARQPIDTPALLKLALRAQALERLLATEGELPGLLSALSGQYVPAAYGGDPVRNPESLPTGRNLTGLDPARLPTRQAYAVAQTLFADWLRGWQASHPQQSMPQQLALSLWAGETLRHQGIMEAQALVALGVEPVWDDTGRPTQLRVIPRAELGRERVDVLLSVTGSYRDQFPALMALLDRAVASASRAEADNPIARHSTQVRQHLQQQGLSAELAAQLAQVRSFGNVAGDYGTGISSAVQDERLQADDPRLGQLFLQRMSQPYLNGQPLALGTMQAAQAAQAAQQALGAHLRQTDAAVLSRSSHLYAMVTSDDPFQYLGGLAAAARSAGRAAPLALYVNELQDPSQPSSQSAERSIALEMQSRYLHPGWLQGQKAEGYAGTLQVLKAVQFAWGWQAVARNTVRSDHWQSFYDVLVRDRHQLGVPQWLRSHPQAYAQTLERLIQAERQGYWQTDTATRQSLAALYRDLTRQQPLAQELPSVRRWAEQHDPAAPLPGLQIARSAAQAPTTPPPAAPAAPAAPAPPPQGLLLRAEPPTPPSPSAPASGWPWLLIGLGLLSGSLTQGRGRSTRPTLAAT